MEGTRDRVGLRKLLLSPLGLGHPALAIAASRAAGVGVLDLELSTAPAIEQLDLLAHHAGEQGFGVRLGAFDPALAARLAELVATGLRLLILGREQWLEWQEWLSKARFADAELLLELSDTEPLDPALLEHIDGLLLKGHEAAGFVGKSSSFILAQHWRAS